MLGVSPHRFVALCHVVSRRVVGTGAGSESIKRRWVCLWLIKLWLERDQMTYQETTPVQTTIARSLSPC